MRSTTPPFGPAGHHEIAAQAVTACWPAIAVAVAMVVRFARLAVQGTAARREYDSTDERHNVNDGR